MNALIKENSDFLRALTQCIIPNGCHRMSPETREINTLFGGNDDFLRKESHYRVVIGPV